MHDLNFSDIKRITRILLESGVKGVNQTGHDSKLFLFDQTTHVPPLYLAFAMKSHPYGLIHWSELKRNE